MVARISRSSRLRARLTLQLDRAHRGRRSRPACVLRTMQPARTPRRCDHTLLLTLLPMRSSEQPCYKVLCRARPRHR